MPHRANPEKRNRSSPPTCRPRPAPKPKTSEMCPGTGEGWVPKPAPTTCLQPNTLQLALGPSEMTKVGSFVTDDVSTRDAGAAGVSCRRDAVRAAHAARDR